MYLNKAKIKNKLKLFKKRKKQKLIFKDSIFFLKNKFRLYKKYITIYIKQKIFLNLKIYKFFFLKLRRISKKKRIKTYVNINCNHFFSKKSKNSRMGKGTGKFLKFIFRTKSLKPIFIFYKMSISRALKFIRFLNKKSSNNFFLFF